MATLMVAEMTGSLSLLPAVMLAVGATDITLHLDDAVKVLTRVGDQTSIDKSTWPLWPSRSSPNGRR
jgi:H+/Cl- antiporter ClcA